MTEMIESVPEQIDRQQLAAQLVEQAWAEAAVDPTRSRHNPIVPSCGGVFSLVASAGQTIDNYRHWDTALASLRNDIGGAAERSRRLVGTLG